jgi:hypothetical protein
MLTVAFFAVLAGVPLQRMREIMPHVDRNTLVVFDIDNTVLEPMQTLGSDQWFYHLLQKVKAEEKLDDERAIDRAMEIWNAVQQDTQVRAVEPETPALIRELQQKGIATFALTARTLDSAEVTKKQLRSIGVDFAARPLHPSDLDFTLASPARFTAGILFAGEKNAKGDVLLAFLAKVGLRPKRVLFIDDKEKNVVSVERSLTSAAIPHVVFRYGAADPRVSRFRADVADMQYQWWRRILSDDAAQDLLDPAK